jgi:hypothetical protein
MAPGEGVEGQVERIRKGRGNPIDAQRRRGFRFATFIDRVASTKVISVTSFRPAVDTKRNRFKQQETLKGGMK